MKFRCERYPKLKVYVDKGKYVQFEDGELDTKDDAAIKVLKNLPADRRVKLVGGRPSKSDADGGADGGTQGDGNDASGDAAQTDAK